MKSITPFNRPQPWSALGAALLILLFIVVAAGCAEKKKPAGEAMPEFALNSALDESTINSRDLKGTAMLINFFATWCPPCRQEVPTLITLQNKYAGENFTVLAISVDQGGNRTVRNFISELGINYPVVMSAPDTPKKFGDVFGIPTSFLIDRQGNIVQRYDGYVEIGVLERDLRAIL